MKSKFKLAVAALAVVGAFASAPASAVISGGDGASLFLEVTDTVNGRTYFRDLGITLNNFGTTTRPTGGFTNIADDSAGDSFSLNLTLNNAQAAADSVWGSFIAGISGLSNLVWNVVANDEAGGSLPDQRRVAFTSTTDVDGLLTAPGSQWNNGGFTSISAITSQHLPLVNGVLGANESGFTTDGSIYNTGFGGNLAAGGPGGVLTSAALNTAMGFFYGTRSSASAAAEAIATQYGGSWLLSDAGLLTWTVGVAAVPEPGTLGLFAAGGLLLSGIARRRRNGITNA